MGEDGECKVNPEYHERRHRRKHALRRFLILAGSLLVIALLLLGFTAFIVWLVLRPIHSPSWEVDDVKVITMNIQSTTTRRRLATATTHNNNWSITTFLLNADMVVVLRANNRNHRMEITYDRIDMRVAYATAVFGRAMFVPFTQARKNCTIVGTEVKAMSVPVTFVLANALQAEIQSGSMALQVYVDVRARVRIGSYRSFGFGVKTVCDVSTSTPVDGRAGLTPESIGRMDGFKWLRRVRSRSADISRRTLEVRRRSCGCFAKTYKYPYLQNLEFLHSKG